jgi:predicted RNA-binding protein with PUA-like domain
MNYWLVKSDPDTYGWPQLINDGHTDWTGVRNHAARLHLLKMAVGEPVLFYHSNTDKAIMGLAKVTRAAYPDPTATEGNWVAIDLAPVRSFAKMVTLAEMKKVPALAQLPLITIGRLSVMPITPAEYAVIEQMGQG